MEVIGICLGFFFAVTIPLTPVFLICGLWMAGFRVGSIVVAVLLALGLSMQITGIGRTFLFGDDWHSYYSYYVAQQCVSFAAGLLTTWYALVILRHMLFSKTMPWADQNNKKPESDS